MPPASFPREKTKLLGEKTKLPGEKTKLTGEKTKFARGKKHGEHHGQVQVGVAAVEEPGRVPPARPQQLLHAVSEEPGTQQHFYKEHNNLESLAVIQFDFGFSNCTFSISFQFRA